MLSCGLLSRKAGERIETDEGLCKHQRRVSLLSRKAGERIETSVAVLGLTVAVVSSAARLGSGLKHR